MVGAERFLAEIKTTANLQHPHNSYSWSRQYDVHPDGDQFLLFQYESERSEVTVVVGFIEELKERVEN